jgi:nucleoside-diphosphate-sugar epimerase
MNRLLEIPAYRRLVARTAGLPFPWDSLRGESILLTGATGLIGSFLVDVLRAAAPDCRLVLVGRSPERARQRFAEYWDSDSFVFVPHSFSGDAPFAPPFPDRLSPAGVFHLASNTHPAAYASDPIGTIRLNVLALDRLLDWSAVHGARRFLFASSNEIYGENRGDAEFFDESYCGYIDCNTLRAGYPESKRCGEALCQAYFAQRGLPCLVARVTRTYGPTVLPSDTKAVNQFFGDALAGRDIVLKSAGSQHYSFLFVPDTVSGLLTVFFRGIPGQAYNIADPASDITLRGLAALVAETAGLRVVHAPPAPHEKAGFSVVSKARLDASKLRALGWSAGFGIRNGVQTNFGILRSLASTPVPAPRAAP